MSQTIKIIVGWVLLALGVGIILWSAWVSYSIYSGSREAPQIFEAPEALDGLSQKEMAGNEQEKMQQAISEQLNQLMPQDSLPKMFNLAVWSMYVFILIFAGGKVATIGVKILSAKIE